MKQDPLCEWTEKTLKPICREILDSDLTSITRDREEMISACKEFAKTKGETWEKIARDRMKWSSWEDEFVAKRW